MKITSALESVADLVSDERKKREEVEAVLSQIHELTEAYFEADVEAQAKRQFDPKVGKLPIEDFEPAPRLDYQTRWKNFKEFRERQGDPPARAEEVASEMCKD